MGLQEMERVFCSPVDCIAVFLSRLIGNFVEMGD